MTERGEGTGAVLAGGRGGSSPHTGMTAGALDRVIRRATAGGRADAETCGLCDAVVGEGHAHVLDERKGELLCACRPCALLFERDDAGRGHYRLVPARRIRLSGVRTDDLGVPVGLAFFVAGRDGTVAARYPSPAGATGWTVDPAAWATATAGCAPLASMRPAVEALLVNTARGAREQWLVPVDDCYRLVGVIKKAWTGLSGGHQVWTDIERFFGRLREGDGRGTASGRPSGPQAEIQMEE